MVAEAEVWLHMLEVLVLSQILPEPGQLLHQAPGGVGGGTGGVLSVGQTLIISLTLSILYTDLNLPPSLHLKLIYIIYTDIQYYILYYDILLFTILYQIRDY